MTPNPTLFNAVAEFISYEADLLDHKEYQDWLSLWSDDGLYIVPIDQNTTDYASHLNFAYDDAEMRELRVKRFMGGESVSSNAMERTIRSVSRFRITATEGDLVEARCAMQLSEVRHDQTIHYSADLEYRLKRQGDSFVLHQKVVRLLNSNAYLRTVAFVF
ncbi:MAG: hypothetical protein LAT65_13180 [Saccharospirillum sp.]|nr:hypothetical protein [Saccharospirillum sp.]